VGGCVGRVGGTVHPSSGRERVLPLSRTVLIVDDDVPRTLVVRLRESSGRDERT